VNVNIFSEFERFLARSNFFTILIIHVFNIDYNMFMDLNIKLSNKLVFFCVYFSYFNYLINILLKYIFMVTLNVGIYILIEMYLNHSKQFYKVHLFLQIITFVELFVI
jgi:hypothetical protein